MQKEIEKQYNELRGRFGLPEFREINSELEISDFEETNFLLRAIIRGISEKIDFYSTMMEEILQPDASNIHAMHETRCIDEEEKGQMYDLYRKLMDFNRQSIELSLEINEKGEVNEKGEAEFINQFFSEWKGLKKEMLIFVRKMRASWKTEADIKEDVGYLG